MRRVIGGKVYDTAKAVLVHEWDNAQYGDFNFCEESLYRTRNGGFFLAGEGGLRSSYAVNVGGSFFGSGEGLRPITDAEAREWLETHDGRAEVIEEHFETSEA
jgi:hypothetical protein